ncbi:acyltransferase [Nonomuraea mesophila]|uniref:Acyltransferase n=2 Tax=Nonomuraea mesophila TaxID=2530382 RepID=A0A4R5FX58_9ACTN|nr:acyltransferase [Nonomuraea mesophila]
MSSDQIHRPTGVPPRGPIVLARVHALDGIRALAALMILIYHVALQTGLALQDGIAGALLSRLDVAVSIFFVLSGLLLYRPWAFASLTGERPPGSRDYLIRRALRILPLYWIVVVVAIFGWSREHVGDLWTWLKLLTLTHNYDTAPWWNSTGPPGLMQMWSLSVEAAFYLTLPLMALLLSWLSGGATGVADRAKRQLVAVTGVALASFVWTLVQFSPVGTGYMQLWLPRYGACFAGGMALAVVMVWLSSMREEVRRTLTRWWWICWIIAGAAYALASTPVTGGRYVAPSDLATSLAEQALYAVISISLVAPAALTSSPGLVRRLLANRPVGMLGGISYGIFLWQFIAIDTWYALTGQQGWTGGFAMNLATITVLTLLYAFISGELVEKPIRRRMSRRL